MNAQEILNQIETEQARREELKELFYKPDEHQLADQNITKCLSAMTSREYHEEEFRAGVL